MDFHCHLDLYPRAREVYEAASQRNSFTWLVTTSPRAFAATTRALAPSPTILISPGLHPEIAHDRANELPLLLEQMERSGAVGEVGLDGSPRYKAHYAVQRHIFSAVVQRSAELGGRTLSVHSRRAVRDVLAELASNPGFGIAVLHWFSGTHSELKAAVAQGCWFSVGPAMFESASGRALAGLLPRDRVVPESDGPFAKVNGKSVMPWSSGQTAQALSSLWGLSFAETENLLTRNGRALLGLMAIGNIQK